MDFFKKVFTQFRNASSGVDTFEEKLFTFTTCDSKDDLDFLGVHFMAQSTEYYSHIEDSITNTSNEENQIEIIDLTDDGDDLISLDESQPDDCHTNQSNQNKAESYPTIEDEYVDKETEPYPVIDLLVDEYCDFMENIDNNKQSQIIEVTDNLKKSQEIEVYDISISRDEKVSDSSKKLVSENLEKQSEGNVSDNYNGQETKVSNNPNSQDTKVSDSSKSQQAEVPENLISHEGEKVSDNPNNLKAEISDYLKSQEAIVSDSCNSQERKVSESFKSLKAVISDSCKSQKADISGNPKCKEAVDTDNHIRQEAEVSAKSKTGEMYQTVSDCLSDPGNKISAFDPCNSTEKHYSSGTENWSCLQELFHGFDITDFEDHINLFVINVQDENYGNPKTSNIQCPNKVVNTDNKISIEVGTDELMEDSMQVGVTDTSTKSEVEYKDDVRSTSEQHIKEENYNLKENEDPVVNISKTEYCETDNKDNISSNEEKKRDSPDSGVKVEATNDSNTDNNLSTNKDFIFMNLNENTSNEELKVFSDSEPRFSNVVNNLDDYCEGYHSSDFEFITESDAEADGLYLMSEITSRNKKNFAKTSTVDKSALNNTKSTEKKCNRTKNITTKKGPKPSTSADNNLKPSANNMIDYRGMRRQFLEDEAERLRQNHIQPQGQNFLDLFHGPNAALAQDLFILENKSIRPYSIMNPQYEGIGFDMRLDRHQNVNVEERKESENCAKMILDMYPIENRRRMLRRRRN